MTRLLATLLLLLLSACYGDPDGVYAIVPDEQEQPLQAVTRLPAHVYLSPRMPLERMAQVRAQIVAWNEALGVTALIDDGTTALPEAFDRDPCSEGRIFVELTTDLDARGRAWTGKLCRVELRIRMPPDHFEITVRHELGHALGLGLNGHSDEPDSIMHIPINEETSRITERDVADVLRLYAKDLERR